MVLGSIEHDGGVCGEGSFHLQGVQGAGWVQARYLGVPGSDPVCYDFLWDPRAYGETRKMKVLEFWADVNIPSPLYEDALRDEEEKAQARISTMNSTAARASVSSRALSSGFPTPSEV